MSTIGERKNYLYLYDLPRETTTSNKLATIIMEKTGHILERKPQIRRDLNRPFYTAIITIPENESFQKVSQALRYFDLDDKMCRALPFDNELQGANQARLLEQNVFIHHIPKETECHAKWLEDTFKQYGEIKSLKISLNEDHSSRGYGFICFQEPASAAACREANEKSETNCAMKYQPKDKREFRRVFNNIFVKNLPIEWDEAKTREEFGKFGPIGMIKFAHHEIGPYAMIAYFSANEEDRETGPKAAFSAVEEMNGKEIDGKTLYVKQFLNKAARMVELSKETMKYKNSKKRCNLYVKNIPENSNEETIRELFSPFGELESIRLFPKEDDGKKGEKKNFFCFVCFRKPDAASTAKERLHNTPIQGQTRPLCINHYEIKEIREL